MPQLHQPAIASGHKVDVPYLLLELLRLLAVYLSSEAIAGLPLGQQDVAEDDKPSAPAVIDIQCSEVTRILLTAAISVRILDDGMNRVMELLAGTCGALIEDVGRATPPVDLSLREACNKIVHANEVVLERAFHGASASYLLPSIQLKGTDHRRRSWSAELDVIRYCTECVQMLRLIFAHG